MELGHGEFFIPYDSRRKQCITIMKLSFKLYLVASSVIGGPGWPVFLGRRFQAQKHSVYWSWGSPVLFHTRGMAQRNATQTAETFLKGKTFLREEWISLWLLNCSILECK